MIDKCVVINDKLYCWNDDFTDVTVSKDNVDRVDVGKTIPTEAMFALMRIKEEAEKK